MTMIGRRDAGFNGPQTGTFSNRDIPAKKARADHVRDPPVQIS